MDESPEAGNAASKSYAGSNVASNNEGNEGKKSKQHVVKNSHKVTKVSNVRGNNSSGTKRQTTEVSFTTVMTPKNIEYSVREALYALGASWPRWLFQSL